MLPMYMLCDGSLGDCNCLALRAAAKQAAQELARNRHGAHGMYQKCRCTVCQTWNTQRMRDYRANKKRSELMRISVNTESLESLLMEG